jgi:hypothetical protein
VSARERERARAQRGAGGGAVFAGGGCELTGSIETQFSLKAVFTLCRWVDFMGMEQNGRVYAPARHSSTGILFL